MKEIIRCKELTLLCASIKQMVAGEDFQACDDLLRQAMALYPSAPQPHNLLGLVLEKQGNHSLAMKHFRAAWALDPSYAPAGRNLTTYGTFFSHGAPAYDEDDCQGVSSDSTGHSSQDDRHLVRRNA